MGGRSYRDGRTGSNGRSAPARLPIAPPKLSAGPVDRRRAQSAARAHPEAPTTKRVDVFDGKGRQTEPDVRTLMIDSPDPMSRVGAFFDVDRTIVSCNTGRLFLRDLRRRGEISFFRTLRALVWMAKYHLSLIDLQWVAARIAGADGGQARA